MKKIAVVYVCILSVAVFYLYSKSTSTSYEPSKPRCEDIDCSEIITCPAGQFPELICIVDDDVDDDSSEGVSSADDSSDEHSDCDSYDGVSSDDDSSTASNDDEDCIHCEFSDGDADSSEGVSSADDSSYGQDSEDDSHDGVSSDDDSSTAANDDDHCTCCTCACVVLIELSSFEAIPENGKVVLRWTTDAEIDNAGFNIYRTGKDGGSKKINETLIPAKGSPTEGASYEFVDDTAKFKYTYSYLLEDIDVNGVATEHGPVSLKPRWYKLLK